jgi:hypothetical protein
MVRVLLGLQRTRDNACSFRKDRKAGVVDEAGDFRGRRRRSYDDGAPGGNVRWARREWRDKDGRVEC